MEKEDKSLSYTRSHRLSSQGDAPMPDTNSGSNSGPFDGSEGDATMSTSSLTSNALSMPNPSVLSPDGGLNRYLSEIRKFPMLAKDEEFMLAKRWAEHADPKAAHKLVTSHLRLVAKIAMGYRGYGLPIGEVISEGNVGLMQAVKKFDPDKGFRLATYAMWWIKAAIQEYVLRSWSLVKMGTTAAQKKLFFNLRKVKSEISALEEGDMRHEQVAQIATKLGVSEDDVISMNRRMSSPDSSLNAPLRVSEGDSEWQDWLADDSTPSQETVLADSEEYKLRMSLLEEAMGELNERERAILTARRLQENPTTLEDLADRFGVSRERVRQIEVRAFEKLQKAMMASAQG
ncbi:RNA polymerase, sigma 32 subunit, RpoH [Asticcacaulis excentricus CB 48]|uniref:RNA polymerase sigma factor RpoH n=2 Tax=Asticcacaulis excentricus TaxID=78587 RepID=E8RRI8_ASTEC|nr:RNA polymerase, sigma 32 subunit, RpoH [Asticcacaulis excentricus CB 48]